jgi:hypothetical protein
VTGGGCESNCRSHCPATEVLINAPTGENLDITGSTLSGPACRQGVDFCSPDPTGTLPCVQLRIVGIAEGACDLSLTFGDGRPPFAIHALFGPETTVGCCRGFPAMGDAVVTVPSLYGDAAADATGNDTTDGGADGAAATDDAGDASDASGTD